MKVYSATDVGQKREINQDYIYVSADPVGNLPNLFVVADGMGGHNAGDYASSHGVNTLVEQIRKDANYNPVKVIRYAIEAANTELLNSASGNESLQGMGTTMVVCTIVGQYAYVANIGDSRLYLIRKGQAIQITKDHSYVEEMVERGRMRRGSAEYARSKNIITRAVGIDSQVSADFFEADLMPGDRFLLCSDGLSNMVDDDEIAGIAGGAGELSDLTEKLVSVANRHGGRDNISVILADPEISEVMRHDA